MQTTGFVLFDSCDKLEKVTRCLFHGQCDVTVLERKQYNAVNLSLAVAVGTVSVTYVIAPKHIKVYSLKLYKIHLHSV